MKPIIILLTIIIAHPLFSQESDLEKKLMNAQRMENLSQALSSLKELKTQYPHESVIDWTMAFLNFSRGNLGAAAQGFIDTIKNIPQERDRYLYLNRIRHLTFSFEDQKERTRFHKATELYREGRYQEAIQIFLEVESRNRFNAQLYLSLAQAYGKIGDNAYAIRYLERARTVNPVDAKILGELKHYYKLTRDHKKLLEILDFIEEIYGKNPFLSFERGFTFQKMEQNARAREIYARMVTSNPDFSPAYFRLAQLLLDEEGQKSKAREYLKIFLSLGSKKTPLARQIQLYFPVKEMENQAQTWLLEN